MLVIGDDLKAARGKKNLMPFDLINYRQGKMNNLSRWLLEDEKDLLSDLDQTLKTIQYEFKKL